MHELAIANKILDSQITDAAFKRGIERNKILHDCKTKGFKNLQSMGHLSGGIKLTHHKAARDHTPFEFATEAAKMVNDGMTMTAACEKFGRNTGDLKYYCGKFGIHYESKFKKKQWDYDATYVKIRRLVNDKGYRLNEVAIKLEASPKVVINILKAKGRVYNAKTIKIERIKK